MEPTRGDERLEGVTAAVPGRIDRSLPPPPKAPLSVQMREKKPRARAFYPASALVVVLPFAVWDHQGEKIVDESFMGKRLYAIKIPDGLVELPHFIGLALVIATLTALAWLVLEYWLQGWSQWWFMLLGTLCLMGAFAALIGREMTAAIPEHDFPGFGWLLIYGYLCACVPLSILMCVSLYKIGFKAATTCFRKLKVLVKKAKIVLWSILGGLVGLGLLGVVLVNVHPGLWVTEFIVVLTLGPLFMGAIGAVIGLIVSIPFTIPLMGIWLILFRSADLMRRLRGCQ